MAQDNTQSDYQEIEFKKRARRRLVGSIALVLLMIVVLPMVLVDKHHETPKQDLVITIPSEEVAPVTSAPAPAETANPTPVTSNDVATPPEDTPDKSSANSDKAPDKSSQSTTTVMVQVGVFSDAANVKQIQSKLESNGFKVQTNSYPTGKIRVRVGPFASRSEADTAIAKLQTLKFNPMVVND